MSEIKGQLLGILLTAVIFASVAVAVKAIFNNLTTSVSSQADALISENVSAEPQLKLMTY